MSDPIIGIPVSRDQIIEKFLKEIRIGERMYFNWEKRDLIRPIADSLGIKVTIQRYKKVNSPISESALVIRTE